MAAQQAKAAPTARQVAAEALVRVERQGAYSTLALDGALRQSGLDSRDAGFATALFYLTLERRITLDHCIAAFCPHKLSPAVRAILQTALAQLLYMDQVPASAAVSQAVALCRSMGQHRSAGLVNAVLRSFIRAGSRIPPIEGSDAERLAIETSCHPELAAALMDWYGPDTARAILQTALGRAPVFLRVNRLKNTDGALLERLSAEGIEAEQGPISGCVMVRSGDAAATSAYDEGLFFVQDLSSQQAALTLAPQPGERILDLCAAPGGKSFALAIEMGDTGEVLSCDIHPHRVGLIASGAERLGLKTVRAVQQDGLIYNPELGLFDRVLCDLPCSGIGVIRRKPELKYNPPESFAQLPDLQFRLLSTAARYVKPGGRLLYTTCTLNPGENEDVAARFLAANPHFVPDNCMRGQSLCTLLPTDREGGDGFFIAAMKRKGERPDESVRP